MGHKIQGLRDDSSGGEDWRKNNQSTTISITNPSTRNGPGVHNKERARRCNAVASAAAEGTDGQRKGTTSGGYCLKIIADGTNGKLIFESSAAKAPEDLHVMVKGNKG